MLSYRIIIKKGSAIKVNTINVDHFYPFVLDDDIFLNATVRATYNEFNYRVSYSSNEGKSIYDFLQNDYHEIQLHILNEISPKGNLLSSNYVSIICSPKDIIPFELYERERNLKIILEQ